ncbi:MAG: triose-phosphate isomerase [Cellvibrionaceae bacterium]|nr:triose-phosphate isomerase [Cellvibrionaceae bacterium]MCV6627670.1 triose-phosphate isomerase [Cellvibrionaceae bacterium]
MAKPLVLGNWKMNGSIPANAELLKGLRDWDAKKVELGVCPPAVYLPQCQVVLNGSDVRWGGQDVSTHPEGAYTGEVSARMLRELGSHYVLVGHSERRQYHGETDALVAEKFKVAQAAGLVPVLCIGETQAEREAEQTLAVIERQLQAAIDAVGIAQMAGTVVAYEPVWAIGTGLTASPEQAQAVHAAIRAQLGDVGAKVQVLYGGSVKPDNAAELFGQRDIDGALVGGASLKASDFLAIAKAAV